ncbi:MAG: signal peptide peptidase SppA [Sedimentisphaerales bacterium]|jgi:protease-4
MDIGNINDSSQQPGGRKGAGWKILWAIITGFSVLANVALFLLLIGAVVLLVASGQGRKFTEEVIEEGPRNAKIAIVSIDGIIDDQQAQDVYWQLKTAKADKAVKGLIIRVNSPGGTLSGSDQIHNEILNYRVEEEKPVVAFMQGVAASGGYYSSVACDTIIAEPTTITGSIGVIMGYLVLQQLLEEKLGIQPIVVKAGEKKDWPSPFQMPTDEQLQYLQERIISPAYNRFVDVVVDGRRELTKEDVHRLADGSVYWADQALKEKLIDGIGYLNNAIDEVKAEAGIEKAQVVEYRKPFSLADILSAKTGAAIQVNQKTLYELTVPQVLYLWTGSR